MAKVKWTETALNNIDAIAEYISIDSAFYATRFVKKLFEASIKLEKFPEIGRLVPELHIYKYREIILKNTELFIGLSR